MEIKDPFFQMANQNRLEVRSIKTTLFDLIAALQDQVCPFEDWIILEAVRDFFETGQAKFIETKQKGLFDSRAHRRLL